MSFAMEQKIVLVAFDVAYYDRRDAKPRPMHHERVVLNGGRLNALERLEMRPASWIAQQFEQNGYAVAEIKKGQTLNAHVDLNALWTKAAAEKALKQLGANAAKLMKGAAEGADKV